jgi:hypothetical protein
MSRDGRMTPAGFLLAARDFICHTNSKPVQVKGPPLSYTVVVGLGLVELPPEDLRRCIDKMGPVLDDRQRRLIAKAHGLRRLRDSASRPCASMTLLVDECAVGGGVEKAANLIWVRLPQSDVRRPPVTSRRRSGSRGRGVVLCRGGTSSSRRSRRLRARPEA